ncbi:MAG: sugar phosphate nucleotidyltransferase [bacterium]
MKAVVLAGGLGTRLHPLTVDIPKPMVPIANKPLLNYILELLARHGFKEVSLLLYHLPKTIKDHFKDGQQLGLKLNYFEAPEDYGTAGAVKFACRDSKEPVLVVSADLLTDIDLTRAVKYHRQKKSIATMVLVKRNDPLSYGIVITGKDGRVKQFLEKPSPGEVFSDTVNAGIYFLEPEAMQYIPDGANCDFSFNLFPNLLKDKKPVYGYVADGHWSDIGQLEEYSQAQLKMVREKDNLIGPNSLVATDARLTNCIVGSGCNIGRGAELKSCVIWDGVMIGENAKLEKVVLGRRVKIGAGAKLAEGVVVGDETEIGKESDIRPYVKIWPRKVIGQGSTVSRSIIWREHWSKSVFGQHGVNGLLNVEITPQFATSLGAAFGTVLGKGVRISTSRDSHKSSRMIYRSLVSGMLSVGVNISNLEMVPIPINRFEIRSLKSLGGFHVRKSPFDPEVMDIKLFDSQGMDLSPALEKKIERIFFGEDYNRTGMEDVGELSYPFHRVAEEYKAELLAQLANDQSSLAGLKLVIDYAHGSAANFFPSILGNLDLEVVALNAYADENKITKDRSEFERSWTELGQTVKSTGADLGVMLDAGAEKIFLVDERGQIIDSRQALAIFAILMMRRQKNSVIGVPVTESAIMEKIAAKYQGKIRRTKSTYRGMMEAAQGGGVVMVGERHGGFIFPDFMPAFDGMLSVCKLISFLAKEKIKLSAVAAEVPKINQQTADVHCGHDCKAALMRRLAEAKTGADKQENIDGIKFWHGSDSVLVLPSQGRPIVHIFAEAETNAKTKQILNKYLDIINKLMDK